jgi:hypothetical protein
LKRHAAGVVASWLESPPDNYRGPITWLESLSADRAETLLGVAAQLVAGVLAILITVAAIVVELAANRYTHRITQLFVREPVNFLPAALRRDDAVPGPRGPEIQGSRLPRAGFILGCALVARWRTSPLRSFRFPALANVIVRIRGEGLELVRGRAPPRQRTRRCDRGGRGAGDVARARETATAASRWRRSAPSRASCGIRRCATSCRRRGSRSTARSRLIRLRLDGPRRDSRDPHQRVARDEGLRQFRAFSESLGNGATSPTDRA